MRPKTLDNLRACARAALLAALVITPLVFWTATADLFNLVKITTLWVLGTVAVALCAMWLAERRAWPRPRVLYAIGAFAAVLGLATLFASNQAVSFIGIYHRYNGLVPQLLYMAIALAVIGLYWEKPDDLRQIAVAVAVAASLIAVYVILQEAGFSFVKTTDINGQPSVAPDGTLGNSNFAGGFLGLSAPFFVFLGVSAQSVVWKRTWLALLGVVAVAVWFSQSRGGMVAAVLALLVMAFCYRELLPRWVRLGSLATLGALVVVALLVAWHPGTDKPIPPLDKVKALSTDTLGERGNYWLAAGGMFVDNPVLGLGPDGYFENYPQYRTQSDAAKLGLYETDSAHNIFFDKAADLGILGVLAYLCVAAMTLVFGYRSARVLTRNRRLLITTFLAVYVGYLVQGFFSIDVPPLAVMGWVAIGGIAAMADPGVMAARTRNKPTARAAGAPAPRRQQKKVPVSRNPRWLVHVPIVTVGLVLIVVGARPLIADVIAHGGQEKTASSPTGAEADFLNAISWHPLEPAYRNFLGTLYGNQADAATDPGQKRDLIQKALASHKKALELRPGNIYYLLNIAGLEQAWAEKVDATRFPEADKWFRRAVAHDPKNWEVHMKYGEMLMAWADKVNDPAIQQKAREQFQLGTISTNPNSSNAWVGLGKTLKALGDTAQARAAFEHAARLQPKNEEAKTALKSLDQPAPAPAPAAPKTATTPPAPAPGG